MKPVSYVVVLAALLAVTASKSSFATLGRDDCVTLMARLSAPADPALEKAFVPAGRDLLIRIPEPSAAVAAARNEDQLKLAREVLWPAKNLAAGKGQIGMAEAESIFNAVKNHPVASLAALPKYDPMALMKYCYGRAVAVQLEAVTRVGVAPDSIRKVWAVGNLTAPWAQNFHVASMIKGPEGKWIVLDINQAGPLYLEDWLAQMKKIDNTRNPNMEILFTDGDRLLERRGQVASPDLLMIPQWRGYFEDLLKSYLPSP